LASGAKALICKADNRFLLFVMPASRRLASKQIRQEQKIRSLRFASREEVEQLTTLSPGAIPPFGSLFGLPTWCDEGLSEQPQINFNAGDHSTSISMAYADYAAVEKPLLGRWAEPA
jgi:Ala-tRNA(Pro) deacylase